MVNTRMKETLLEANIDPFTIEGRSDIYCRSSFLSFNLGLMDSLFLINRGMESFFEAC